MKARETATTAASMREQQFSSTRQGVDRVFQKNNRDLLHVTPRRKTRVGTPSPPRWSRTRASAARARPP